MFSSPEKNILEFGIIPGQRIVDIGAGSGFYSLAMARLVGPAGHIYAVDISEPALVRIKNEAEDRGLENIDVLLADVEGQGGTHLVGNLADIVLLANTLFQLQDRGTAIREIRRILKPGGIAVVIDWTSKLTPNEARRIFTEEGLTFHRKFEAGEQHYGLIFRK